MAAKRISRRSMFAEGPSSWSRVPRAGWRAAKEKLSFVVGVVVEHTGAQWAAHPRTGPPGGGERRHRRPFAEYAEPRVRVVCDASALSAFHVVWSLDFPKTLRKIVKLWN